jgi:hypothetical protein
MGLGMSVPAVTGGTGQGWCLVAPGDSSRAWTVSCQVMVDTELWKLKRPPRGPAGRGRILYTVKQPAAVLGLVSGGRRLRCRPDRRPAGSGRTGGCHGGTGGTGHRRRRDQRRQRIEADQQIDGGPSVLYDAVAWFFLRQAHPSWPANRRHGTSSPTPTPTANSSATPVTQHRCSTPPASASCGTTASSNSAATEAPPASSPPAGSSGSGNVRPRPDAGFLAGDPPPSPVHLCPGLRPASTEQGTAAA